MKRVIYFILISSITFLGLQSIDSFLNSGIIFVLDIFTSDIARSYNSIVELTPSYLGIKILMQKGFGASSAFNSLARTNMHIFFPISIFAGICFSKPNKKSVLLFILMSALTLAFFIFKTNILLIDHLMRDLITRPDGQVLSVLKNPTNKERLISILNEIFNINGPIYSKYYFLILSYLILYKVIFKVNLRSIPILKKALK